jgi:hypothetical protein
MPLNTSKNYVLGFKIAAGVVPVLMAAAGYYFGDIQPVVRDVCGLLLSSDQAIVPSSAIRVNSGDAGAPR